MSLKFPDWRLLAATLLLLQACAQVPSGEEAGVATAAEAAPVPEDIHLNLPGQADCECPQKAAGDDFSFFEKGLAAVGQGSLEEGAEYFQRYQRLDKSAAAQWEAAIALAYIDALASNPERDLDRARSAYRKLSAQDLSGMALHPQSLFVRQALENLLTQQQRTSDAKQEIKTLQADLGKRDETIKRLRELTLGQKGASP